MGGQGPCASARVPCGAERTTSTNSVKSLITLYRFKCRVVFVVFAGNNKGMQRQINPGLACKLRGFVCFTLMLMKKKTPSSTLRSFNLENGSHMTLLYTLGLFTKILR